MAEKREKNVNLFEKVKNMGILKILSPFLSVLWKKNRAVLEENFKNSRIIRVMSVSDTMNEEHEEKVKIEL